MARTDVLYRRDLDIRDALSIIIPDVRSRQYSSVAEIIEEIKRLTNKAELSEPVYERIKAVFAE